MYKYKCWLCGGIKWLSYNVQSVKYYCEVRGAWTKLYRTR